MSGYRISSMEEIRAIEPNGFKVVSTFSGAGGSCLGYRMAGFSVLWANEFIPAAAETYRANFPTTLLDTRDIRTIMPEEILQSIGLSGGEIDLFDGSPPCASFSTAGKREATWGKVRKYSDTAQRVDDLFFEYIRLLRGLRPKVFVAENVSGLVKGTAKGYFLEILREMKASGYNVKAKVLDAQFLGVPQSRQRLIFVGVRSDLGLDPKHPKPQSKVWTIADALGITLRTKSYAANGWIEGDRPAAAINASGQYFVEEANGLNSKDSKGHRFLDVSNEPFPTIQAQRPVRVAVPSPAITMGHTANSIASVVHPLEKRRFSIAELKRICAFPDDFILTGSYSQQWERMGRAVPPLMMKSIAETIRNEILCQIR